MDNSPSLYVDSLRDPNSRYVSELIDTFSDNPYISLIGIPYDGGILSYRRGARLGPESIRKALYNFTDYCSNHETQIERLRIRDYGNVKIREEDGGVYDQMEKEITKRTNKNGISLILGGDHSTTYSSFKGVSEAVSGKEKKLNLIVLDQHYDVRDYSFINSGSWLRHLLDDGEFAPRSTVIIGSHGFRYPYKYVEYLKKRGVLIINGNSLRSSGISSVVSNVVQFIDGDVPTYLSVDIDTADQAFAPGCSGCSPGGLLPYELFNLVSEISMAVKLVGVDLTEYSPFLDIGDITQKLATSVLMEVLCGLERRTPKTV